MTSKERIYKTIKGEAIDRSPFSLWRHFPKDDQKAESFAKAVIEFQKKFKFDLVKITSVDGYFAEAFGAKFVLRKDKKGRQEGIRKCIFHPVKNYQGWRKLPVLDIKQNNILVRETKAIKLIRQGLDKNTPIVQTIPNPLTLAKNLRGDLWIKDLKEHPENLKMGLNILAKTIIKFSLASLKAGADGIFFFTQMASHNILNEEEYKIFGSKYDIQILKELKKKTNLLILPLTGF